MGCRVQSDECSACGNPASADQEDNGAKLDTYTVGCRASYFTALREGPVKKLGARPKSRQYPDGYPGGYAVHAVEDGEQLLREFGKEGEWAVFGLKADWETDTEPAEDGWWHNLLVDSYIVVLGPTPNIDLSRMEGD